MMAVDRTYWRDRLKAGLIPAVPVPMGSDGEIHQDAQERFVRYLREQPIAGVAVWVHTGRGLHLRPEQREQVMRSWQEGLPRGVALIAGAGALPQKDVPVEAQRPSYTDHTLRMAEQALKLGADALLAYAPVLYRHHPRQDEWILQHHEQLARLDVPIILFYLYEEAGGISYSLELLDALMQIPQVIGIKMATLDSVVTFQDVATLIKERYPEVLLITGEDRFLSYSFMLGSDAALIGMGCACTDLQARMISAYFARDFATFHHLADRIERFARVTFYPPWEKYIVRMLSVLELLGVIPAEAVHDPLGYAITPEERQRIRKTLQAIEVL